MELEGITMLYDAEIMVVGCGNMLFKDDGFGPAVIKALEEYFEKPENEKPDNVLFIDAGTAGPQFVFSLPNEKWKKVIVVDVAEYDAEPGTLRMFTVDEIPKAAYEDVHSWPVNQPLHTLAEKCDVKVLGCKPQEVSAPDVVLGLTEPVENAIPQAINIILNEIGV